MNSSWRPVPGQRVQRIRGENHGFSQGMEGIALGGDGKWIDVRLPDGTISEGNDILNIAPVYERIAVDYATEVDPPTLTVRDERVVSPYNSESPFHAAINQFDSQIR